ncbi:MAG: DUF507 family protein [Bdellovibrionales bacterium]|nr:DUF507 family protein [Bdellovibrionales bacterium]
MTRILNKLINEWKSQNLLKSSVDDSKLLTRLHDTFAKELRLEDDLNKEVDQLLSKYEKQFERGELDRRKMHQMVKVQLAKEKKVIL